jgi:hypothetical protein
MTDKPIVPNEWTDLFVAVIDFATACGGSFHCSDPVKAEAMARVFNATADMLRWNEETAFGVEQDGRAFAADLVTRARNPIGRYTVMGAERAMTMLHLAASKKQDGLVLVTGLDPSDQLAATAAPRFIPSWRPGPGLLTWPNGATARVINPRNMERIRGLSASFCLVTEWPSQEDWPHVELAVREGAAQIVMLSEPPYPIGGGA